MFERLVLASNNQKKLRELTACLSPLGISLVTQSEFGVLDADETGLCFVENAIIKARHAALATGLPALADDSGLEVDALKGAPGIYSARYADGQGDAANNQKLLAALVDVAEVDRTARFHCVIAIMRHATDPMPLIFSGSWEGHIRTTLSGTTGFGYDPLFQPLGLTVTSAELPSEQKNQLSHRARAIAGLTQYFNDSLLSPL